MCEGPINTYPVQPAPCLYHARVAVISLAIPSLWTSLGVQLLGFRGGALLFCDKHEDIDATLSRMPLCHLQYGDAGKAASLHPKWDQVCL